ncbi:MAG: winged helix-turn-helix transcriptional regulator [Terriglobales bacterium]
MSQSTQEPVRWMSHEILETLTRPWMMDILSALSSNGPMRFGVLRRSITGISCRILTERLRLLEQKKFVLRHFEPTIPPAVTYSVTSRVADIEKAFEVWDQMSRKWHSEDTAAEAYRMAAVGIALNAASGSTRGVQQSKIAPAKLSARE